MEKKGLSKATTLFLIFIICTVVIAATWLFAIPFIKGQVSRTNLNIDLSIITDGGYTLWDEENRLVMTQVRSGKDSPNVIGLDVVFTFERYQMIHFTEYTPEKGTQVVFFTNLSNYPGTLESIKLVPIFEGQIIGDTLSKISADRIPSKNIRNLISSGKISAASFSEPVGTGGIIGAGKIQGRK